MTDKEKLNLLEELLDVKTDTLKEDDELEQISEWDSMASIAVIAMLDEKFNKLITPEEVKGFRTVKDIIDAME